jgi:hypothetical protein
MTGASMDYTSFYILNREYFGECFDESAKTDTGLKAYRQAIFFMVVAGVLFTIEVEAYFAWFMLCLGGVELLSVRYKRSWWIARQMISRAAGSKVNLRINDQGIFTDNAYQQQSILWNNITNMKSTEKGFVIIHDGGTSYLSKNGLNEDVLAFLALRGQC